MKPNTTKLLLTLIGSGFLAGYGHAAVSPGKVLENYANIAHATYEDSLITARDLQKQIGLLLDNPSDESLSNARQSWIEARIPYQQSEAFRFGNAIVDDWESRVNAWPLDEGLIDYVDGGSYGTESDENPLYSANIIGNTELKLGGQSIDVSTISPELISETLHEIDGVEANVASGYHAIEFLLWGQDLNGTNRGAGNRPATDFDTSNCTGGNCDRRAAYLSAVSELLVTDLEEMVANWELDGAGRKQLVENGEAGGLAAILTGLGSLSYGELAGERTKLGLLLHDPEEEHDCFSDNTHASHYYDAKGIRNVYLGEYKRIDGTTVSGDSLSSLVAEKSSKVDTQLKAELLQTEQTMQRMVDAAANGDTFDVLIGSGNKAGNAMVLDAVNALTTQTRSIEKAIEALDLGKIELEGSDSLDNPSQVTGDS